ncbi:MAG: M23 family metallopeptidase [Candidatus Cloacimonetes bacterium]|jgi:murein DD-endopeptidase MepM/ murein hydrolase activator NlpD|nr:M23 family metallopeptidase [Candidatus Cloacimonadota bacterium]MBT4333465.1 M23 family metallopeptidase [Candidatus Cloacimonadota bacterium]MBT4574964.1 M23 family metallopeptidase [Candidatus Cloacimonadota bacterium]
MKKVVVFVLVLLVMLACSKQQKEVEEVDPFIYKQGILEEGETLANALLDEGIENGLVYKLVNQLDSLYDLRRAHPNDSFMVKLDTLNILHELSFRPNQIYNYRIIRDTSNVYFAQIDTLKLFKEVAVSEGEIESSLWQGMSAEGIDAATIVMFTQIFQWDIDFFIDPQKGDKFYVVYEKNMDNNGKFVKSGNILAARYSSRNYSDTAYRYTNKKDETRYYDNKGKCIQKAFLKSPLNYRRISSYFGTRTHPITKKKSTHNGVDYAAARGTPVEATASGVVTKASWNKRHTGETVKIRHPKGYVTLYGHLSKYGKFKVGDRVQQHDIIGYVGSTGRSTGPHLHYTIYHHGKAINPLKLKNVAGPSIPKDEMGNFLSSIESLQRYFISGSSTVPNN